MMEIALLENLQREDLNAMEEAWLIRDSTRVELNSRRAI